MVPVLANISAPRAGERGAASREHLALNLGSGANTVIDLVRVGCRYRGVVIDLQVRSESGQILASSRGFEWTQELIDLDPAVFPMLAGLCAYLDTVFNQRQIPLLLAELEQLPAGLIPEPARAEVRRFSTVVMEGQHFYLWFCGD